MTKKDGKKKPMMALVISVGPKMPKKPEDTATPDDKAMKKAWNFMKNREPEPYDAGFKRNSQSFGLGPGGGSDYERAIYEDRFEDDEPAFPDTSGDMEGMSANERALFLAQQSMERPERTTPSIHSDLTPEQLANYRAKLDRMTPTPKTTPQEMEEYMRRHSRGDKEAQRKFRERGFQGDPNRYRGA
jgi:hypothetical protein|tara:strand:+ start:519 stop:1079 length:561 start_codon:yes stop_codon:yes gene_type:complete